MRHPRRAWSRRRGCRLPARHRRPPGRANGSPRNIARRLCGQHRRGRERDPRGRTRGQRAAGRVCVEQAGVRHSPPAIGRVRLSPDHRLRGEQGGGRADRARPCRRGQSVADGTSHLDLGALVWRPLPGFLRCGAARPLRSSGRPPNPQIVRIRGQLGIPARATDRCSARRRRRRGVLAGRLPADRGGGVGRRDPALRRARAGPLGSDLGAAGRRPSGGSAGSARHVGPTADQLPGGQSPDRDGVRLRPHGAHRGRAAVHDGRRRAGDGRMAPRYQSGAIWPNLFIVGAPKAGTTSLHTYLARHPEAFMCDPKEPHYFSSVTALPAWRGQAGAVTDPNTGRLVAPTVTTESAYASLFVGAGGCRVIGESSTSYLADPEACRRIRETAPDARIIIMIRDPVERAISHHLMYVREGWETRSLEQAVDDELREGATWAYAYLRNGWYRDDIRRYLDAFGDRVLVIVLE